MLLRFTSMESIGPKLIVDTQYGGSVVSTWLGAGNLAIIVNITLKLSLISYYFHILYNIYYHLFSTIHCNLTNVKSVLIKVPEYMKHLLQCFIPK